jgi:hypothetical protein
MDEYWPWARLGTSKLCPSCAMTVFSPISKYNEIILIVQIFYGYFIPDAKDPEGIATLVPKLFNKQTCTVNLCHCTLVAMDGTTFFSQ